MVISITLTGEDLLQLIQDKIGQEVSKHGHPGSFETEILFGRPTVQVPLRDCPLKDCVVMAVAKPKTPQAEK